MGKHLVIITAVGLCWQGGVRKHLVIFTSNDAEYRDEVFDKDDSDVEVYRGKARLRFQMTVNVRNPLL